jgi:uncharacterized protein (TIGR02391 family)
MVRPFTLSADEVVGLPVDELAFEVLRDIDANHEWSRRSWLLQAEESSLRSRRDAINALAEAWSWLYAKGLVAEGTERLFVTRLGRRVLDEGVEPMRAIERLGVDLHAKVEGEVRPQFLLGKYRIAAFAAMRAVEIRVRQMANEDESAIGVALMRRAFGPRGPLRACAGDKGELDARMNLFAGAIGLFKNPSRRREVALDDPTEASEVVLLADLLMRILDQFENTPPA